MTPTSSKHFGSTRVASALSARVRFGLCRSGSRFTLLELLVVIAVIAILASLLLPSLNKARFHAKKVSDMSNMRQMTLGCLQYALDHDGTLPQGDYNPSEGPKDTHVIMRDWTSYEYVDYRPVARDYNFMAVTGNPVTGAPPWDDPRNTEVPMPGYGPNILRHSRTYAASHRYSEADEQERRYVSPVRVDQASSAHVLWRNWLLRQDASGLFRGTYLKSTSDHYNEFPDTNVSFQTLQGADHDGMWAATYDGAVNWCDRDELEFRIHANTGNHIYFVPNP